LVYFGNAVFLDNSSPPLAIRFGSLQEADGSFYTTGNFLNGFKHGTGICLLAKGETWDGECQNDVFVMNGQKGLEINYLQILCIIL
jgi:hypothetical protein